MSVLHSQSLNRDSVYINSTFLPADQRQLGEHRIACLLYLHTNELKCPWRRMQSYAKRILILYCCNQVFYESHSEVSAWTENSGEQHFKVQAVPTVCPVNYHVIVMMQDPADPYEK